MAEELESEVTDLLCRVEVPAKTAVKAEEQEAWNTQKKTLEAKIAKLEREIDDNKGEIAGKFEGLVEGLVKRPRSLAKWSIRGCWDYSARLNQ